MVPTRAGSGLLFFLVGHFRQHRFGSRLREPHCAVLGLSQWTCRNRRDASGGRGQCEPQRLQRQVSSGLGCQFRRRGSPAATSALRGRAG